MKFHVKFQIKLNFLQPTIIFHSQEGLEGFGLQWYFLTRSSNFLSLLIKFTSKLVPINTSKILYTYKKKLVVS